jgi:hypothetical protein
LALLGAKEKIYKAISELEGIKSGIHHSGAIIHARAI